MFFSKKNTLICLFLLLILNGFIHGNTAFNINKLIPDLSSKIDESSEALEEKQVIKTIASINVLGSKTLDNEEVLKLIKLKLNDEFNEIRIRIAKSSIKKRGIYKRIDINVKENNTTVDITIELEENPIISDIIIEGNTTLKQSFLNERLNSKKNEPFNLASIRKDIQLLENSYEKIGLFKAKVYNIKKPEINNEPLIFYVAEGIISDISITGNLKTRDYVILRELDIRPGDKLTTKAIRSNLRKVYNLNYFTDIRPHIMPTEKTNEYTLDLELVEKQTSGAFTLGGGYAPNQGFNFFSDLFWDNVMGSGQLIMLKGNFGLGVGGYENSNSTYQFKYHNPWAFGRRRSFTFKTWTTSGAFNHFDFASQDFQFKSQERRGLDIGIGIPHSYDIRSYHNLKYESVSLVSSDLSYNIYSYRMNFSVDKRDFQANPRKGSYHNISIEQAFKFRRSAIDFTQFDLTFRQFIPMWEKQTIMFRTTLGYIRSPEINNEDLFAAQYYYIGGANSVRGYADNNPFAFGNIQVLSTLEYRYIFSNSVTAYSFIDIGFGNRRNINDSEVEILGINNLKNFKLSKGIGIKFILPPLGPIRLDFGITEEGIGRLQVNLGHSF